MFNNTVKHSFFFYLLVIYFFLSPLEDILTTEFGTILKYLAGVIGLIWIFDSVQGNNGIEISKFTIIPIYLVALSWFSAIWAFNLSTTVSRNTAYTLLIFLYLVVINRNYRKDELAVLDIAILLGGVVTCVYSLYYTFSNLGFGYRLVLTANSDPNGFVGRVLLSFYVSFKFLIGDQKRFKLFYFASFMLLLYSILLTGSRGAFVSVALTILIWLYSLRGKMNLSTKFVIFLSIIMGIIIAVNLLPQDIFMRIYGADSYIRDLDSDTSRSAIWKSFFTKILPLKPILGFGSGAAGLVMQQIRGRYQGMHNTYFNMWLEYGIFGLPVFILFLFSIYKKLIDSKMLIEVGLLIGTLGIIFFLDAYAKKYLWNILSYLVILSSTRTDYGINKQRFRK